MRKKENISVNYYLKKKRNNHKKIYSIISDAVHKCNIDRENIDEDTSYCQVIGSDGNSEKKKRRKRRMKREREKRRNRRKKKSKENTRSYAADVVLYYLALHLYV